MCLMSCQGWVRLERSNAVKSSRDMDRRRPLRQLKARATTNQLANVGTAIARLTSSPARVAAAGAIFPAPAPLSALPPGSSIHANHAHVFAGRFSNPGCRACELQSSRSLKSGCMKRSSSTTFPYWCNLTSHERTMSAIVGDLEK